MEELNENESPTAGLPREPTAENARAWAVAYLAYVLNLPAAEVDLMRGLADYGLDSMDAVVMAGEMEVHFGIDIDPALFLRPEPVGLLIAEFGRPMDG
jgi:acyl carrier protein